MEDIKPDKMLEHPQSPECYLEKISGIGQSAGQGPVAEWEKGWLAGFWDGEGSFTVFKHIEKGNVLKYKTLICAVNTDPALIQKAVDITDRLGVRLHVQTQRREGEKNRESYVVQTAKAESIRRFIQIVLPYLVGKRAQALLLLRFVEARLAKMASASANRYANYDEDCASIEQTMRVLNAKGPNPQRPYARARVLAEHDMVQPSEKSDG